MPTFTTPVDLQVSQISDYFGGVPADADPSALALAAHYRSGPRGRNVYLMNDGSVTENQPPNWDGTTAPIPELVNPSTQQPYAVSWTYAGGVNPPTGATYFTLPANQQVARIYWGGVANPITAAEKTILLAAGYPASSFGP